MATRTLTAACQLVLPGEEAPSHRHTMAALRFIIEGSGGCTIVDGQPLSMEPGDVILTPSWTFHGHAHEGTEKMLWLDVLDVPLVRNLDSQFYEEYSQPRTLQRPEKRMDESAIFSYKRAETREALHRLTESGTVTLKNRRTGGPVMPTINASMQLLKAGHRTNPRRTLGN